MAMQILDNADGPKSTGAFPTPGPVSAGDPEHVAKQRADLGLSDDPSGESDSGWKPETKVIAPPDPVVPADPATQAETEQPAPTPAS
jgi:hypothetical protein